MTIYDPPDTRTEEELQALERISEQYELEDRDRWMFTKPVLAEDMPPPEGTIYDNPSQTALVLRGFYQAHSTVLKTIPLKFPEALNKYDPILETFANAYVRTKSLDGRTGMTFMEVREIFEDENADEDQDELDEEVLGDFDYTPEFRREYLLPYLFKSDGTEVWNAVTSFFLCVRWCIFHVFDFLSVCFSEEFGGIRTYGNSLQRLRRPYFHGHSQGAQRTR